MSWKTGDEAGVCGRDYAYGWYARRLSFMPTELFQLLADILPYTLHHHGQDLYAPWAHPGVRIINSPTGAVHFDGRLAYAPAWEDVLVWDVKRGEMVSCFFLYYFHSD